MAVSQENRLIAERFFGVKLPDTLTGVSEEIEDTPTVLPDPESDQVIQQDTDNLVAQDGFVEPESQPQIQQTIQQQPQQQQPPTVRQGRIIVPNEAAVSQQAASDAQPFNQAFDLQGQAVQRETQGLREINQAKATGEQKQAEFNAETGKQMEAIKAAHALEAETRLDEINKKIQEAANFKVDPKRIWTDGGSVTQAAGLVSAFIGGFLSPVLGRNDIQPMLDKIVDRDIMAQREEKDSLQRSVDRAIQFDTIAKSNAGSEEEAFLQQRAFRLSSIQGQMQAQLTKLQDPVLIAQGEKALAQIGLSAADTWNKLQTQVRSRFERQAAQENASIEAGRARAAAIDRQKRDQEFQKEMIELKAKAAQDAAVAKAQIEAHGNQIPISTGFFSLDGKSALTIPKGIPDEVIKDAFRAARGARRGWADIEAIKKTGDFSKLKLPNSDTHRLMKQFLPQLVMAANSGKLGGQFSQADFIATARAAGAGDLDAMVRLFGSEEGFKKRLTLWQNSLVQNAVESARDIGGTFKIPQDRTFVEQQREIIAPKELKKEQSRNFINTGIELGKAITSPDRAQAYAEFMVETTNKLKEGEISSSDGRRILDQAVRNNSPDILVQELKSGIRQAINNEQAQTTDQVIGKSFQGGKTVVLIKDSEGNLHYENADEQTPLVDSVKQIPTKAEVNKLIKNKQLTALGIQDVNDYNSFASLPEEELNKQVVNWIANGRDRELTQLKNIANFVEDTQFSNRLRKAINKFK